MLVNRYKIKPENVVILSPYRSQCHNIREELLKKGYRIPVMSVVKSQGTAPETIIFHCYAKRN